jgi:hypothetical protein
MILQHRLEMRKLREMDQKLIDLGSSSDTIVFNADGFDVYKDDYKWINYTATPPVTGIHNLPGTVTVNFVDKDENLIRKWNDVKVDSLLHLSNGVINNIKIPISEFPSSPACRFGFDTKIDYGNGNNDTYHFSCDTYTTNNGDTTQY